MKKKQEHLLAVHTANNICMESKKKNITSSDTEAPSGKHSACVVSNVAKPLSEKKPPFFENQQVFN